MPAKKVSKATWQAAVSDKVEQEQKDVIALNNISVPITQLRLYLSALTAAGITEIPLGSLWLEVRRIVHEQSNA